ncbi:MAG TPA: thiamine-phosphate kinase, partial [Dehalococcoidia bacterium]|nr:thiamine-phosphate kinase [Dehalococcoidia bacterium]
ARVPVDRRPVGAFGDRALDLALFGGEDYELLFAAPPDRLEALAGWDLTPISVIGEIVAGPPEVWLIDDRGIARRPDRHAWDHLAPE